MGHEKVVRSWVRPWDWLSSGGLSLHTGKNSRASHSKVKQGLFKAETHFIDRMCALWRRTKGSRTESSVFDGVGDYTG